MINELNYAGEFLLSEASGTRSREEVTFAATVADIQPGTVVGIVTASGHYAPYSNVAVDGTQTAVGVLYAGLSINVATQKGVIVARDAEVDSEKVIGEDAPGIVDLKALGIIVR
jgi:hypothetical protein